MSELFPRVGALQQGYRVEQVDRYFEIAHEIYDAGELGRGSSLPPIKIQAGDSRIYIEGKIDRAGSTRVLLTLPSSNYSVCLQI